MHPLCHPTCPRLCSSNLFTFVTTLCSCSSNVCVQFTLSSNLSMFQRFPRLVIQHVHPTFVCIHFVIQLVCVSCSLPKFGSVTSVSFAEVCVDARWTGLLLLASVCMCSSLCHPTCPRLCASNLSTFVCSSLCHPTCPRLCASILSSILSCNLSTFVFIQLVHVCVHVHPTFVCSSLCHPTCQCFNGFHVWSSNMFIQRLCASTLSSNLCVFLVHCRSLVQ